MKHLLLALASCLCAACSFSPPGQCVTDADCGNRQACSGGVCAGCSSDSQCFSWQSCNTSSAACITAPGHCGTDKDCAAATTCGAGNVCTGCTSNSQCASWQSCSATHACVAQAGRCGTAGDCASWQTCDATNTCATAAGSCAISADCASWQECGAQSHACAPKAGACNANADCTIGACSNHACQIPSDTVLLWGTLIEGVGGVDAIASLDHPERPLVGMPLSTRLQAFIDPSGSVVYFDGVVFRKFVPVPFSYATPWQYPANPTANSPVIGTCPTSIFCDGGFQMQQDTGALIARTSAGWVDLQGRMLVTTSGSVLAWNSAGYFLVYNLDGLDAYGISVRDPQGRDFPVTAFGPHAFASLFPHARAHGSDFWIVFQTSTTERSLWTIAANGTATKTGDYAPYDKPISQRFDAALAADGSFWNVLTRQNPVGSPHYVDDYIVRLPLVPGTPTVVYDEGTFPVPPPSGANNAPPRAWYHSSFLFTSP